MNSNSSPSVWRVLWNDYLAFIALIFPIASWVMAIFFLIYAGHIQSNYYLFAGGVTLLGVLAAIWRYRVIAGLFENGQMVDCEISAIEFFRDRGNIQYIYMFHGEKFEGFNAVMKNKSTQKYAVGQTVKLMVNPEKPKQAFLQDLYTKEGNK